MIKKQFITIIIIILMNSEIKEDDGSWQNDKSNLFFYTLFKYL